MFGKEPGSADIKDFIKISGKSVLSDCLHGSHIEPSGYLVNYLITDSNCVGGRHPYSFTIKGGIRLNKVLADRHLSAEKRFCNCFSSISIKGIQIDLL